MPQTGLSQGCVPSGTESLCPLHCSRGAALAPHALLPRFGEGSRIPLEYTRAVMQAIHSGERTSCCQHTKHQLGERIGGALSQLRRDEWLCLLRSAVPRTRTPHLQ